MTTGEISAHFAEIYGASGSKERWKPALNAFAATFADLWPAAETY